MTCINKVDKKDLFTTVIIYQNQHVELTLQYVLFTIYIYMYHNT